jgi:transcriptional regulator with XRE-family HTH domain
MDNIKKNFSERLKNAMSNAGYEARPCVLEKGFNLRYFGHPVSFQAVSSWLKGESIPTQDKLQVLAEWFGVEAHFLRFGRDPLQKGGEIQRRVISGTERQMMEIYNELPPEHRKVANAVILALAAMLSG